MRNEITNAHFNRLNEQIKNFTGGKKQWIADCQITAPTFTTYTKGKKMEGKKMEIYRIGLGTLARLRLEEQKKLVEVQNAFSLFN